MITKQVHLWMAMFSMLASLSVQSQSIFPAPFHLPKSPNTASLEKFGDTPIALSTGKVDINLPLYTLVEGDIQIPISLSYNNSGLQVREIPSWVGAGWDLHAAGTISAEINGLPDFGPFGILAENAKQDFTRCYAGQMSVNQRLAYFQRVANGEVDAEHDIYSFNFLGRSGKFYFDFSGNCVTIPKSPLKISFTSHQGQPGTFIIIDEKGLVYRFENKEGTNSTNYDALLYSNFYNQSASVGFVLTQITSPKGDTVHFEYKIANQSYVEYKEVYTEDYLYADAKCAISDPYENSEINIDMNVALLTRIESPNTIITFASNTIREDLLLAEISSNSPLLDSLVVKTNTGSKVQVIHLVHEYFQTNKRLKLKEIEFLSPMDGSLEKKFQFIYYKEDATYPSLKRKENSIDHWGYYNGASNSTLLIPSLINNFTPYLPNMLDADRSADSSYSVQGLLKEIIYPTGGRTLFEYESNRFQFSSYAEVPLALRNDIEKDNSIEYETILDVTARSGGPYNYGQDISQSFNVPDGRNKFVKIFWSMGNNDPSGLSSSLAEVRGITGVWPCEATTSTTTVPYSFSSQGSCTRDLAPGQYQAIASALTMDPEIYNGYAYVRVDAPKLPNNLSLSVGGLRVSKVTHFPLLGQPPIIRRFDYDDTESILRIVPRYDNMFEREFQPSGDAGASCIPCANAISIYADNLMPRNGPLIEYPKVTEIIGANGEGGKIHHEFYTISDIGGTNFPFASTYSITWPNGVPKVEEQFKVISGHEIPVVKTTYEYQGEVHQNYNGFDQSLKVGRTKKIVCDACLDGFCDPSDATVALQKMAAEFVPIYTEYYNLRRKSIITYTDLNDSVVNETQYLYDGFNKNFMSAEVLNDSKGFQVKTTYQYPQDVTYIDATLEASRQKLIQENQLALLTEKHVFVDAKEVYSGVVNYLDFNGMTLPATVEETLSSSTPVTDRSIFNFYRYDNKGNVLEQGKKGDLRTVYLFGYGSRYPIAEIRNADWQTVNAKLIEIGLNLSTVNALNDSELIKTKMTALRHRLPHAQLLIRTYLPNVGLQEAIDVNGVSTLYTYDKYNRLQGTWDNAGNLISKIGYGFSGVNGAVNNYVVEDVMQVKGVINMFSPNLPEDHIETYQYFDGLGRFLQSIVRRQSFSKKDIVQPASYDSVGREKGRYLPFTTNTDGAFVIDAISANGSYEASSQRGFYMSNNDYIPRDSRPYSEIIYERSPTNRVERIYGPGIGWSNKSVATDYNSNMPNQVILVTYDDVSNRIIYSDTNGDVLFYPPNQLFSTLVVDEDGNEVIDWTDKQGRPIAKWVEYGTGNGGVKQYSETYYVYDDRGELVVVLPPEAVTRIKAQ